MSINKIPNILNEEDKDVVIEEMVNNENFEKSDTEIETYESIEEIKYPQEYDDGFSFFRRYKQELNERS